MPITILCEPSGGNKQAFVDIVAVHGLFEDAISTWTHAESGMLWLRDLFEYQKLNARILCYEYDRTHLIGVHNPSTERITSLATTFVEELNADRQLNDIRKIPIIFVCHGFGGILAKCAIQFSHSVGFGKLRHLRAIYTSTFGIMFFSTPHHGMCKDALYLFPSTDDLPGPTQFLINLVGSDLLQDINDQFVPLMKRFQIHYFWEQRGTVAAGIHTLVVAEDSAAPIEEDNGRCGIAADHFSMTKFSGPKSHGYAVVKATLTRYIQEARQVIGGRWAASRKELKYELKEQKRSLKRELQFLNHTNFEDIHSSTAVRDSRPIQRMLTNNSLKTKSESEIQQVSRTSTELSGFAPMNRFFPLEAVIHQFTGRERQLQHISDCFGSIQPHNYKAVPRIFTIQGMGGSGKTHLCKKFLLRNRESYWGIFMVDATNKTTIENSLANIGELVGKGANWTASVHWLSQQSKAWLLLLDNADNQDLNLSQYIPITGNGHVLVTTRIRDMKFNTNVGTLRLQGMDPHDAVALLLSLARDEDQPSDFNDSDRKTALEITSELGYLALAISHAGKTIRARLYTLRKYLQYYLGQRKHMLSRIDLDKNDDLNAKTTWEIPFQRLVDKPIAKCRDALDLVNIFAFMHSDSIPLDMFQTAALSYKLPSTSYPDFLQGSICWSDTSDRVTEAARLLASYSLIEYNTKQNLCSLHPVVHQWTQERLESSARRDQIRQLLRILASCISPYMEASGTKLRKQLIPHIESCLYGLKSQITKSSMPNSHEECIAFERFALVFAEYGRWDRAKDLQQNVISYRVRTLGRWHQDTLTAKSNLGETLWNLFDIKSAAAVQINLLLPKGLIRPSIQSWLIWPPWRPCHVSYCQTLDSLTRLAWLAGDREKSKQCGERAVNALTQQLGRYDPITLTAMMNLGRTYLHLGMLSESYEMLQWVLNQREHFFGHHHPETLLAKNELGMVFCKQKDLKRAESYVTEVLELRTEILGEEHAYTLWSVNDLSKVYRKQKRYIEAIRMLEDIVPIVERTLGESHVGMTMTLGNLVKAYSYCKRWIEAEAILKRAQDRIPADHPDVIQTNLGLIRIKLRSGRLTEARSDCEQLLSTFVGATEQKFSSRCRKVLRYMAEIYEAQDDIISIAELKAQHPWYFVEDSKKNLK